jgi:hypothetical protein
VVFEKSVNGLHTETWRLILAIVLPSAEMLRGLHIGLDRRFGMASILKKCHELLEDS